MRVASSYHKYFLNNINVKLKALDKRAILEHNSIVEQVNFFIQHKDVYTKVGVNVDKLIKYSQSGCYDRYKLYGSLSKVQLDKAHIKALSDFIKLVDTYYHKTIKTQYVLSMCSTMPYTTFISILKSYNLFNLRKILRGNTMYIGKQIGNLKVVSRKRRTSPDGYCSSINYPETNKLKQLLLDRGEIPYCKEDAEKAKLEGVPYNGKFYLVYHIEDDIWFQFRTNSRCTANDIALWKFKPSNYFNASKQTYPTTEDYYRTFTSFDEIIADDNIGAVQKIKAIQYINPNYSLNLQ